jgi:S-DNA-T family DNA segregation ATPase FtsK/SpoIIIE
MAKKKAERRPKNVGQAVGFQNILSNEKTDFVLGLLLIA